MSHPSKSTGASNSPKSPRGSAEGWSHSIPRNWVYVGQEDTTVRGQNAGEATGASRRQEHVLGTDSDSFFASVDTIRRENEKKNSELKMVKKELAESKLSEAQLKEKVTELTKKIEKLQKEKENLEKRLYLKEEETEKTEEKDQQYIMELESKLQKKES